LTQRGSLSKRGILRDEFFARGRYPMPLQKSIKKSILKLSKFNRAVLMRAVAR